MVSVAGRLFTTVACPRLFSLVVSWSKLEKAGDKISIGSAVFFLFNDFGPKRSDLVFAEQAIFPPHFC